MSRVGQINVAPGVFCDLLINWLKLVTRRFLGSLNTEIATATISQVPGVQDRPYESRPLEFFGIYNIISRITLLGGFWGR